MRREISSLKIDEVVWHCSQHENARLTVSSEPWKTQWGYACRAIDDFGTGYLIRVNIYDAPAYTGVRWHCLPQNIPDDCKYVPLKNAMRQETQTESGVRA